MTSLPPVNYYIATADELQQLADYLLRQSQIAVDTESNSMYAYRERVCLVQIAAREADWLVDPLAVEDLSALGAVFAAPHVEKVFHAAEYDIMCLKRDYGFAFASLFDTMMAARIVGRKTFGLASMLETHFGVRMDKRYQRADWSIRPLPSGQLAYARQDVRHLLPLRDLLDAEIRRQERWEEACEAFEQMTLTPAAVVREPDPDDCWNVPAARNFSRRQMAILRELFIMRESQARLRDLPPFKVFQDDTLVRIVLRNPAAPDDLFDVAGIGRWQVDRFGDAVMDAVERGNTATLPHRPPRPRREDDAVMARFNALRDWRRAVAESRGVESDVIISKDTLWALARNVPRTEADLDSIPGLGKWKRQQYGEALLHVLETADAG